MKKSEVLKLSDVQLDRSVLIQGTKFDRRRKLNDGQIKRINQLYQKGLDILKLAKKYNVCYNTIKYHIDEKYKNRVNYNRTFYPIYTVNTCSLQERAEYKRSLIRSRKIKVGDYVK